MGLKFCKQIFAYFMYVKDTIFVQEHEKIVFIKWILNQSVHNYHH